MFGLLFLIGLAVVLVALETLVRRAVGEHPHHAASSYETLRAGDGRDHVWEGVEGRLGGFGDGGPI